MNVGMLWLDDDRSRSFDEKVNRAVDYYQEKYGRMPELCLVNKTMLSEEKKVGKVSVQPKKAVLPHHFWLGMKPV
ncbi:MAG: hypothetical protein DHS20C20_01260 [Ardenticatenaceae bacterium]|nr:MAG: hypothetical protein DHS20C20_01260 [Ardenticatenaceae bacterium]